MKFSPLQTTSGVAGATFAYYTSKMVPDHVVPQVAVSLACGAAATYATPKILRVAGGAAMLTGQALGGIFSEISGIMESMSAGIDYSDPKTMQILQRASRNPRMAAMFL